MYTKHPPAVSNVRLFKSVLFCSLISGETNRNCFGGRSTATLVSWGRGLGFANVAGDTFPAVTHTVPDFADVTSTILLWVYMQCGALGPLYCGQGVLTLISWPFLVTILGDSTPSAPFNAPIHTAPHSSSAQKFSPSKMSSLSVNVVSPVLTVVAFGNDRIWMSEILGGL